MEGQKAHSLHIGMWWFKNNSSAISATEFLKNILIWVKYDEENNCSK